MAMSNDKEKIQNLLGEERQTGMSKRKRWALGFVTVAIIAAVSWWMGNKDVAPRYLTEAVKQGVLQVEVTANGTLEAEQEVTIGSELSGIVEKVFVDVNDTIKEGQVLIELDTAKLKASVEKAKAALASAQAAQKEAQATLNEANAKYKRLLNVRKLSGGKTPAQTELDEQAAVVARSQASVDTAAAQIQTAQAELETAQTDLTKAYISSPIDGVVLARSVEPGYAVAASLQAVELLTLASDLKTLDLEIDVDEADVSVVKPGQKATFTVSAYPNKNFPATLTKVAYGPTESETNVVTYTAYLKVTNNELLLRPGMTATARIVTEQRQNALLVPNTALRFAPSVSKVSGSAVDTLMMGPPRSSNKVSKEKYAQNGYLVTFWLPGNRPVIGQIFIQILLRLLCVKPGNVIFLHKTFLNLLLFLLIYILSFYIRISYLNILNILLFHGFLFSYLI